MAQRVASTGRRSWAGIPADERRADRRERLLDAAFDLLGTEGAAAATVRAVCRAAELNTRYFYESFDDVNALLVAVYDRTVTQLFAAMRTAGETVGDDVPARMRAGVETAVAFVDEDRRRGRVLYLEARGNPAVDARRAAAWRELVTNIRSDRSRGGRRLPPELDIGPIRAGILAGGITSLLVEWLNGRLDVSREELIDEATAAGLRIVAGTGTDRRRSRPRP